jgi:hypothetical protein
MVFFAISRAGLSSYMQLQRFDCPLWLAAGVADDAMKERMHSLSIAASTFIYTIDPSDHVCLEGALDTIREHHPDKTVWISF